MQATGRSLPTSSWVDRLDALAFVLLAVMPLGMALVNRSAQPLLGAAALAALAARVSAGDLGDVRDRMARLVRTPIGMGCLAFLLFAAISIGWSHHPKTSLSAYGELLLSGGAAILLHAALPRRVPGWVVKLATVAIAMGCLAIVAELATDMAFRTSLGVRNATFIFKRSVSAILVLGWPVAAFLWITGRRPIAVAAALLLGVATYAAHSSATALGLTAGLAAAILAARSPRLGSRVLAAAFAVAMLSAPVIGEAASRILPPQFVEKLHFAHAADRIAIWQSFGEVVKRRPIAGAGFGTSPVMNKEPVADEVPPERRLLLGAWHPHSGYLQVWAETGLVGAALFGVTLILALLGIGQFGRARAAATCAMIASAGAIMLVGHGLWQGWWGAVIGASAIWLARLPDGAAADAAKVRPALRPAPAAP
ncbi:O-antigen ligase family protein [uncultured Enterovirga sp.]|uniref:O-antigen ligase family protein n=1 Tax=uncultured Enterovirga sp. TaxID=2026352 RepID=UPI0035C96244